MAKQKKSVVVPRLRFPAFRNADGWQLVPLGQAGQFLRGLTYGAGDVSGSGILVLRSTNIQKGELVLEKDLVFVGKTCAPDLVLRRGDVAICMSNGSKALVGKSAEYKGGYAGSLTVGAFCSIFRATVPFAKIAFSTERYADFVALAIGGGNINNLKNSSLEAFEFALPEDPAEQQKVADCLTSLDELITAQGRKVEALKIYKRGLMQQLFPREGEPLPRLRFPEFRDAPEWEPKTLGDACRMQAGKFVAATDIKEQNAGELFPCYGGNGLRGFTTTHTHEGIFPLIGRQGALCGNTKLATGRFHATEHAVVATPSRGVEVVWLYYLLDLLKLNRFATGQAQPGLSVDVLEKVSVTIPNNEPEQQGIARCLTSLDALITAEIQKLEALKNHKKGLLQQLFPSPEET